MGFGEGFYWTYESKIKKWESDINSTVGAAGELFAIRSNLFEPSPKDTLLDDFVISLNTVKKGFKIKYSPDAYAIETASFNVNEELKRKIRIACGGIQTMLRYPSLLNPFKFGFLSFQYFSHKVLRWTIIPFSFLFILACNFIIFLQNDNLEGSINVSGSTVSLVGGHLSRWSQLPGGVVRTEILRGSVLKISSRIIAAIR